MAQEYYSLQTSTGRQKLIAAKAQGKDVPLVYIAVGDTNGESYYPTEDDTGLQNERWRGRIQSVTVDKLNPDILVYEGFIPVTEGGWWIREIALYDEDGVCHQICRVPEVHKTKAEQGAGVEFPVRVNCLFSNAENVSLEIDPSFTYPSMKLFNQTIDEINTALLNKAQREETAYRISQNIWRPENLIFPQENLGLRMDYDPATEVYTVNGVATATGRAFRIAIPPMEFSAGQQLHLSAYYLSGSASDGLHINAYAADENKSPMMSGDNKFYLQCLMADGDKYTQKTVTEYVALNGYYMYLYFHTNENTEYDNLKFKVQFETNQKTEWTPAESLMTVKALADSKAAAGQPTTYNLPVSSGMSRAPACTYSIDPFGQLRLAGALKKSSPLAPGDVLGQLPVGYRPAVPAATEYVERPVTVGSLLAPALLRIYFDGRLELWGDALAGQDTVYLDVTLPVAD